MNLGRKENPIPAIRIDDAEATTRVFRMTKVEGLKTVTLWLAHDESEVRDGTGSYFATLLTDQTVTVEEVVELTA